VEDTALLMEIIAGMIGGYELGREGSYLAAQRRCSRPEDRYTKEYFGEE